MNSKNLLENYLKRQKEEEEENDLFEVVITKCMKFSAQAALDSEKQVRRGGSVFGRRTIDRDYLEGYNRLTRDYFSGEGSVYESKFRRRYRMSRELFLRITDALVEHNSYFAQKKNAAGKLGLHPLQKTTAAMRMLSTGMSADALDEYMRMGESTSLESLEHFCRGICEVFAEEYLRTPTLADVERLYEKGEERGFPGMLGSLDCMHWTWKNCPTAYHGQYRGKEKVPSMILEAVASHDLWIWHCFFGLPGTLNDINVLDRSPIFRPYTEGRSHNVPFTINNVRYTMGYYLVDGIYPKYANLVSAPKQPVGEREKVNTQISKGFAVG